MKTLEKLSIIIPLLILISCVICINVVYADPNSSKGFAEYTDEQAAEETNKLVEEQKNEESLVGKSTNNYLESLEIEGYEITPDFDKQTLEYNIKGKVKKDEITIKAKADDEKAKVEGTGNVKIEKDKNEYRIDVTAESGTVRTYIIKINDTEKKSNDIETEDIENSIEKQEELELDDVKQNSIDLNDIMNNNHVIYIVLVIIIVLMILTFIIMKTKKKKGKHNI